MFKSIWMLLSGMDSEIDQINHKIDRLTNLVSALEDSVAAVSRNQLKLSDNQVVLVKNQSDLAVLETKILGILIQVQAELEPPPAARLIIKLSGTKRGENGMSQVADNGKVQATLEVDDAVGNAGAKLDSIPAWSSSDESVATVVAAADGMSAEASATGKIGSFKLHVEAQAGGVALSGDSEDVDVVVGAATSLKVSVAVEAASAAPQA